MSKFRPYKHPFRFQLGTGKVITFWAKVVDAKKPVTLRLTADDVRQSIALRGAGNTQTCSMAVCAKRQAKAFPHPVEGFIDWTYSRAYVVSKTRIDGTPSECVVYRHGDDVAHLNDAKNGQKRLLRSLLLNGDREITLTRMTNGTRGRAGKKTGTGKKRSESVIRLRGANLRFAVAQLGSATP